MNCIVQRRERERERELYPGVFEHVVNIPEILSGTPYLLSGNLVRQHRSLMLPNACILVRYCGTQVAFACVIESPGHSRLRNNCCFIHQQSRVDIWVINFVRLHHGVTCSDQVAHFLPGFLIGFRCCLVFQSLHGVASLLQALAHAWVCFSWSAACISYVMIYKAYLLRKLSYSPDGDKTLLNSY